MSLVDRLAALGLDAVPADDGVPTVRPGDDGEVAAVIRACRETQGVRAVEVDGLVPAPIWRDGLADAPEAGEPETVAAGAAIRLDLSRLDRIRVQADTHLVTAGAGLSVVALERALLEQGFTLGLVDVPEVPVGAWLAAAEPGPGSSRSYPGWSPVAGLEAVLLDGTPFRTTVAPRSASGPDPKALLVGGGGRIGVITAATLRIHPADADRRRLVYAFPEPAAAVGAVVEALGRDLLPDAFGLLDGGAAEAVLTWESRGDPKRVALVALAIEEVCTLGGGRRLATDDSPDRPAAPGRGPLEAHRGAAGPGEVREAAARSSAASAGPLLAIGFGARWSRVVLVRRAVLNVAKGPARMHLERALPEGALGIVCVAPDVAEAARQAVRDAGGWLVGDADGASWVEGVAGALLGDPP